MTPSYVSSGGVGDTGWLVTADDVLVVTAASSQVNENITANLRIVQEGDAYTDTFDFSKTQLALGNRSVQTVSYPFDAILSQIANDSAARNLSPCNTYLTDVSLEANVAVTRGQTFGRINLFRRGSTIQAPTVLSPIAKCAILSDYLTNNVTACLRNARHFTSIEGPGWTQLVIVPSPPAQTDWTVSVPTNARWRIISAFFQFTTDANVPTRACEFLIQTPPPQTIFRNLFSQPGASNTTLHNMLPAANDVVAGPAGLFWNIKPIPPDLILLPAMKLRTFTGSIQAGDQYSAIGLMVEEWIDNV